VASSVLELNATARTRAVVTMNEKLTIALTKGRILKETLPLLARAGIEPLEDVGTSRKLVFETNQADVQLVIIRGTDVPTYVRHGAADMGVVGKDVLLEHGAEGLYEPLDLGIARCRLMTAGPVGWQATGARIRVATKFVNITRRHFARQGVHADLIKLYGAMELAPIMNLADLIVDIVDTGNTLRANGMEPLEEIASISSRLVVNKAAMRSRYSTIQRVIDDLTDIVQENARGVADATA
jgi:ATP phosphoribosyltransferase